MSFSLVVVAGSRLGTTTTSGLWGTNRFSFCVGGGLQAGCGVSRRTSGCRCMAVTRLLLYKERGR